MLPGRYHTSCLFTTWLPGRRYIEIGADISFILCTGSSMMSSSSMINGLSKYHCTVENDQSKIVCHQNVCVTSLALSCSSHQEIAVRCSVNESGQFRLVDAQSGTHNRGRLEVCEGKQWRAVCAGLTTNTTLLGDICTQLGYSDNGIS